MGKVVKGKKASKNEVKIYIHVGKIDFEGVGGEMIEMQKLNLCMSLPFFPPSPPCFPYIEETRSKQTPPLIEINKMV